MGVKFILLVNAENWMCGKKTSSRQTAMLNLILNTVFGSLATSLVPYRMVILS